MLFVIGRLVFGEEALQVCLIGFGVFGGEEDGAAGETGFECVQTGARFAGRSFRAGGELGIGAIGGELSGRGGAWGWGTWRIGGRGGRRCGGSFRMVGERFFGFAGQLAGSALGGASKGTG